MSHILFALFTLLLQDDLARERTAGALDAARNAQSDFQPLPSACLIDGSGDLEYLLGCGSDRVGSSSLSTWRVQTSMDADCILNAVDGRLVRMTDLRCSLQRAR